jgi:hypothetical protein
MFSQQQSQLPGTDRLAPTCAQRVAYRRLALAILGLDVATLAEDLRSARRSALAHIASASPGAAAAPGFEPAAA